MASIMCPPQVEGLRPHDMGNKFEYRLQYAANAELCCLLSGFRMPLSGGEVGGPMIQCDL